MIRSFVIPDTLEVEALADTAPVLSWECFLPLVAVDVEGFHEATVDGLLVPPTWAYWKPKTPLLVGVLEQGRAGNDSSSRRSNTGSSTDASISSVSSSVYPD